MALLDLKATSIERYFSFYFYELERDFLLSIAFWDVALVLMTLQEILGCSLLKGSLSSLTDSSFISFERVLTYFTAYFGSFISFVDYFLVFFGGLFNFYSFATYSATYFLMSSICFDFFNILKRVTIIFHPTYAYIYGL